MQVTNSNNVKIYDLSCGKSLPEWLSERKRRKLQKKDIDIRRRVQLIQDFEMPVVSNNIKVSPDCNYIFATGVYKPRIRCYDVKNLSMKFERCFNEEAVQFAVLSEDFSKFVLLLFDRSVEFHSRFGGYYHTRMPKFGRDLAYHQESCDLYLVGASSEMYRLNLEQGRFLNSLQTNASSVNKVSINEGYDLIACGTMEGKVQCWDPRVRQSVATLDCALSCMTDNTTVDGFPSITSLNFKDGLTMAVGTFTGQILLYDIRTNKPHVVKDHMYGLPIKNIEFIKSEELVMSMDPKCVKIWQQKDAKPYTTIQAPAHLNDLCLIPNTGLLFLANEDRKMLTYFIPNLGPAPSWCSFLDSITEELEESKQDTVYDDYKFVTVKELEELHLDHLQGTALLRAYMHGYFMDIRLYNKAKAITQPTAFKDVKKKMVRSKIDKERINEVVVKQMPGVNRDYAKRLLEKKMKEKLKIDTPFEDDRFKDMFENPDFTINQADEEYKRIKSIVEKPNKKKVMFVEHTEQLDAIEEEEHKRKEYLSSEEEEDFSEDDSSEESEVETTNRKGKKVFEAKDSDRFSMLRKNDDVVENIVPLGERLHSMNVEFKPNESAVGNKLATFSSQKSAKQIRRETERKEHQKERARISRPAKMPRK